MKIRNVLSCFDGISAGIVALQRAGIEFDNYYAFEIDKFAIKCSMENHPNIIQLGDINNWEDNIIEDVDLIIGGFQCQSFSLAGRGLGFDDPRGQLFFVFDEIIKYYNPNYFLAENVKMKKVYQDVISKSLNVEPIIINSSLVSAQNRVRLYWTNIPNVTQPKDLGIILQDICENIESIGRPCELREFSENALCHHIANALDISGNDSIKRVYACTGKAPTLTTVQGGHREPKIYLGDSMYRKLLPLECEKLQTFPVGYCNMLSKSQANKVLGNSWTVDVIAHIFECMKSID